MKTLFKTYTQHQKCRDKQLEYEAITGVKWDFYRTGNGMRFTPIVTLETPMDEEAATALMPYLTKEYYSFIKLTEVSGLDLQTVLSGAKTLAKTGRAVATVNRNGRFAAIRKKHAWEK